MAEVVLKELINGRKINFSGKMQQQVDELVAQTTTNLVQLNQAVT